MQKIIGFIALIGIAIGIALWSMKSQDEAQQADAVSSDPLKVGFVYLTNPGDHGLIRTDFPGGWNDDNQNAFTGKNLSEEQLDMQNYLKVLLNFRKNSSAIHRGKTMHYAPSNGTYLLDRINNNEKVMIIINKNKKDIKIDTNRFYELGLKGEELTDIHSGEKYLWSNIITIPKYTSIILTTD